MTNWLDQLRATVIKNTVSVTTTNGRADHTLLPTATALLVVEALGQLDAAAALLEHGDFKDGVEHNGTDEGDVKAGYMLSDIKNAIYRLREHIEAEAKG